MDKMTGIKIKIPFKTPTINHLYGHHGHRKYLKPAAKELRESIIEIIHELPIKTDEFIGMKLKLIVNVHENWLTKKRTVKKKDVSNREKFLVDSVFQALDLEDSFIFSHHMNKIQDEEDEFAIITISTI